MTLDKHILLGAIALGLATPVVAKPAPRFDRVNMTIDEEPIVPQLAKSLGCLARERITLNVIDILKLVPEDFEMQVPMNDGRVDVAYHWFNHTVFGARHGLPVVAVMNFNDAPGMTVLVANAKRDEIRSSAQFGGRKLALGALYGTKSIVTYTLAARGGVKQADYTQVATASEGRQQAIEAGLAAGTVDVITSEEPFTAAYRTTGLTTPLYALTDRAATEQALGATWPAQSLLMAPKFLAARPAVAQRVVNAFVCAMRFVNSHDAAAIVARLPADYMAGKDRVAFTRQLERSLPTYARGNYSFRQKDAAFVASAIDAYRFDDGDEGRWRSFSNGSKVDSTRLYDNTMVVRAMSAIK